MPGARLENMEQYGDSQYEWSQSKKIALPNIRKDIAITVHKIIHFKKLSLPIFYLKFDIIAIYILY